MKLISLKLGFEKIRELGLLFDTEEEAEAYFEYLKAKAIIKQDTKGFKPNWDNGYSYVYFGNWDNENNQPFLDSSLAIPKYTTIYFGNHKDLRESFKKHPKEWETYLKYEQ